MPRPDGGVPIGGFISPTDTTDIYPVTNPTYGLGGLRTVLSVSGDSPNLYEITDRRREVGMMAFVTQESSYYHLLGGTGNEHWIKLTFSSGGTGPQGFQGRQGFQGIAGSISSAANIDALAFTPEGPVYSIWYDLADNSYYYEPSIYHSIINYASGSQNSLPIFQEFGELKVDRGSLTASGKSLDVGSGTIQFISFSGYTGAATISLTGFAGTGTNQIQSFMLIIGNTGGFTAPTITWSGILWSEETGTPSFSSIRAMHMIPFASVGSPPLGATGWIGGSQLTYRF